MKRTAIWKHCKKTLAFVLAAAMFITSPDLNSFMAQAAGTEGQIKSVVTEETAAAVGTDTKNSGLSAEGRTGTEVSGEGTGGAVPEKEASMEGSATEESPMEGSSTEGSSTEENSAEAASPEVSATEGTSTEEGSTGSPATEETRMEGTATEETTIEEAATEETVTEETVTEESAVGENTEGTGEITVTFSVTPENTATVKMQEQLRKGEALHVTVSAEPGYAIEAVKGNEEILEADAGTEHYADGRIYEEADSRLVSAEYTLENVTEDIRILVETEELRKKEEIDENKIHRLSTETGGVRIVVEGTKKALNGAEAVKAVPQEPDRVQEAVDRSNAVPEEATVCFVYDITLHDKNGKEIAIADSVSVRFESLTSLPSVDEGTAEKLEIFTIDDSLESIETLDATAEPSGTVTFETDHFTLYGGYVKSAVMTLEGDESILVKGRLTWSESVTEWIDFTRPKNNSSAVALTITVNGTAYQAQSENPELPCYVSWYYTATQNWEYHISNVPEPVENSEVTVSFSTNTKNSPYEYTAEPVTETYTGNTDGEWQMQTSLKADNVTHTITVKQQVIGSAGDSETFAYSVKLDGLNGNSATKSIHISGTGKGEIKVPAGLSYTITANARAGYSVSEAAEGTDINKTSGTVAGNVNVCFNRIEIQDVTVTKIWLDNNNKDGHRKEIGLELYYRIGNGEPCKLDASSCAAIGLEKLPDEPQKTVNSYSNHSYTYKGLPVATAEGQPISYSAKETTDPDITEYYLVSYDETDPLTIINTEKESFTATLQWRDAVSKEETRPSRVTLEIYDATGAEPVLAATEEVTVSGDTQRVTVGDLPAYNREGKPVVYYAVEKCESENSSLGTYTVSYDNGTGIYAQVTDKAYEGGTITNTVSRNIIFSGTKIWLDEGESRPEATLTLWRYTRKDGNTWKQASPVTKTPGGTDVITYQLSGENKEFSLGSGDGISLPQFDADGNEYVYFMKETLTGDGAEAYSRLYDNSGIADETLKSEREVLFNGGTLTNIRQETVTVNLVKAWESKASQGALRDVAVTLTLKRAGSEAEVPETATTITGEAAAVTFTNFTDATLRQTAFFEVDKYDPETGKAYSYTAEETKITVGGEEIVIDEEGNFVLNGSAYTSTVKALDDDNNIVVENRLADKQNYVIKKVWNNDNAPEGFSAPSSVTCQLHVKDHAGNEVTGSIDGYAGTFPVSVTLSKTKNALEGNAGIWQDSTTFTGEKALPKYDAEGYEYTYYVTEAVPEHYYRTISYTYTDKTEESVYDTVTATLTNTYANGGSYITLKVSKSWLDDGDAAHRLPVKVGVGVRNITTGEIVTEYDYSSKLTGELSRGNGWQTEITFSTSVYPLPVPPEGKADSYEYFIYETAVGTVEPENYVKNEKEEETKEIIGQVYMDPVSGEPNENSVQAGHVTTEHHKYEVTCEKTEENTFVITNRRVGELSLSIQKEWVDGGRNAEERPGLCFEVFQGEAGEPVAVYQAETEEEPETGAEPEAGTEPETGTGTWTVDMTEENHPVYTCKGLPKYDANGAVISYSIKEKMKEDGGFSEGVVDYYTGTVTEDGYVTGEFYNTYDTKRMKVVNQRSAETEFVVYKVWKDSDPSLRPDIYMNLYYKLAGEEDSKIRPWTGTYQDRTWTAGDESAAYDWKCEIKGLPEFVTEDEIQEQIAGQEDLGKEILYYAQEAMTINGGEYVTSYFVSKDAYEAAFTSETASGLKFAPNGGYIMNRLEASMQIEGEKIWLNIPNGTPVTDLPGDVTFKLYRKVDGTQGNGEDTGFTAKLNATKDGYSFYENNKNNGTLRKIPKYDKDGKKYIYTVVEDYGENKGLEIAYPSDMVVQTNFTLKNYYEDEGKNQRTIQVEKDWYVTSPDDTTVVYPKLTFILYQYKEGETVDLNKLDPAKEVDTLILAESTEKSSGGAFAPVPVYDMAGKPYQYVVEELAVNGYAITSGATQDGAVSVSAVKVPGAVNIDGTDVQKVYFKNTYTGIVGNPVLIRGEKKWDDYGSTYERPGPEKITFQIVGTVKTGAAGAEIKKTYEQGKDFSVEWTTNGTDSNTWSFVIKNPEKTAEKQFPKYGTNGVSYTYQLVEKEVSGTYGFYNGEGKIDKTLSTDSAVKEDDENKYYLNFTEANALTNVFGASYTVVKEWDDDSDNYGLRLPAVTVELEWSVDDGSTWKRFDSNNSLPGGLTADKYKNKLQSLTGVKQGTYPMVITAGNNWRYTFRYLPTKDDSGKTIRYRAVETKVGGIDVVEDKTTSDRWKAGAYQIEFLHDASGTRTTITNTIIPTKLTVKKVWEDDSDSYEVRPGTLTVYLMRRLATENDEKFDYVKNTSGGFVSLTLSGSGNIWTRQFNNLPKCDANGDSYVYTVTEKIPDALKGSEAAGLVTAGGSYTCSVSLNESASTVTLTNTLTAKRSFTVRKEWEDSSATLGYTRPDSIQVELLHDGKSYSPKKIVTLQAQQGSENGDGWSYTWDDLPIYNENGTTEDGKIIRGSEIVYTVREVNEERYETVYTYYDNGQETPLPNADATAKEACITNTLITTSVEAEKAWVDDNNRDNLRPESVQVQLLQDGVEIGNPVTLSEGNSWKTTWSNLPRYKMNGTNRAEIAYSVVEVGAGDFGKEENGLSGYKTSYHRVAENMVSGDKKITCTVTNTHEISVVKVSVTKEWESDDTYSTLKDEIFARPGSVTVKLLQKVEGDSSFSEVMDASGQPVKAVLTASEDSSKNWKHTFDKLPEYGTNGDGEKGKRIIYSVIEEGEPKQYEDPVYSSSPEADESGPEPDADGNFNLTITNTLKTTSFTVTKEWKLPEGLSDADKVKTAEYERKLRSEIEKVQYKLQASADNGATWTDTGITDSFSVDSADSQTKTFEKLPAVNASGEAYTYRAVETALVTKDGSEIPVVPAAGSGLSTAGPYTCTGASGTDAAGTAMTTLTNTLGIISINGSKIWDDASDADGVRPENLALTVKYSLDGTENSLQTLDPQPEIVWDKPEHSDRWTYTISGLPKTMLALSGGKTVASEVTWYVEETLPDGYAADASLLHTGADGTRTSGSRASDGNVTEADLKNCLLTGQLLVKKLRSEENTEMDAQQNTEFTFTVTLTDKNGSSRLFRGEYEVYKIPVSETESIGNPLRTGTTDADGFLRIRAGEMLLLRGLPASGTGYTYLVEEKNPDAAGFELEYHTRENADAAGEGTAVKAGGSLQNNLEASTLTTEIFVNKPVVRLAIDNLTPNPGNTAVTNAGGRVNVLLGGVTAPSEPDYDDYETDALSAIWAPEANWTFGSAFSVEYEDFADETVHVITVQNYLNPDGSLKPVTDSVYGELTARFPDASISMDTGSGTPVITLVLASAAKDMPRRTLVKVEFSRIPQPPADSDENTENTNNGTVAKPQVLPEKTIEKRPDNIEEWWTGPIFDAEGNPVTWEYKGDIYDESGNLIRSAILSAIQEPDGAVIGDSNTGDASPVLPFAAAALMALAVLLFFRFFSRRKKKRA